MSKYTYTFHGARTWEVRQGDAVIGQIHKLADGTYRPILPNGPFVMGLYTSHDEAADMLANFAEEEADHA
jgi:hypothetical protein